MITSFDDSSVYPLLLTGGSTSYLDEANPVFWLAIWTGLMGLILPVWDFPNWFRKKSPPGHIINSFFDHAIVRLRWRLYWPRPCPWSTRTQIKKLAKIQPSWPRAWSIRHTSKSVKHTTWNHLRHPYYVSNIYSRFKPSNNFILLSYATHEVERAIKYVVKTIINKNS